MSRTILLLGLALTGCTTASTTMLSADSATISASDLSTGSPAAVRRKALVTAAQMAQARGYDYFAVVAVRDTSRGGMTHFRGAIPGPANGAIPGSIGQDLPTVDIGTDLTVRFLRADQLPVDRDGIYNAREIAAGRFPNAGKRTT